MPGASPDPNLQSVQINMQALSSAYTQVGTNAGTSYKAAVVNMQTSFALPDITIRYYQIITRLFIRYYHQILPFTPSELMLPHNNEL